MKQNKETTFEERWKSLTITNRYIFYRVMRDNRDICLKLLQLILPELHIQRIEFLVEEKPIEETPESRGVRLDAYAGDGKRVYDIEMQSQNRDDLPKRSRYNQAMVDEELLDQGANFRELKETYVIFITPFDLFGKRRIRYTFRNRCDEDDTLMLNDGAVKVFINASGIRENADPDLAAFLDLMIGKGSDNAFAQIVQKAIDIVKLDREGRHRYMTVEMWIREEAEIAKEEARAEGLAEGREEGRAEGLSEGRAEGLAEGRAEGLTEGRAEGELYKLILQVSKKIQRSKSLSAIADELESDEAEIRPIYDAILQYGADLSPEEIRQKMRSI